MFRDRRPIEDDGRAARAPLQARVGGLSGLGLRRGRGRNRNRGRSGLHQGHSGCEERQTHAVHEIVQLYLDDEVTSVTYCESVLRGFERVSLKPGEKTRVRFTLTPDDLKLLDRDLQWTVEPGRVEVRIGASSEDIRLCGSFEIK